jgi:FKBP-type peptidyl-prolyl cis-trans isomerase
MKTNLTTLPLLVVLGLTTASAADEAPTFKDDKEKANYAYGLNVGTTLKQNNLEYDAAAFDRGVKDALAGNLRLNPQEQRDAFMKYQHDRKLLMGEKNKAEGEAFLAANKAKPDVKTTASSERSPGGTVSVAANRLPPGWTEALTNMSVGSKWQLFIPSALAYGEAGNRNIPPHATLLLDVELVSFQAPPPPPPPPAPLTSDIIKVPSLEEMKKGAKIETIKAEEVEKLQKDKTN